MITEIVLFDLPKGITREAMIAQFSESIPRWQQNPDMVRKYMIYDLASGKGGGIYLWKCIEHAQRWHDESFRQRILSAFGSEPSYQYFDTPVIVDNATQDVIIEAA